MLMASQKEVILVAVDVDGPQLPEIGGRVKEADPSVVVKDDRGKLRLHILKLNKLDKLDELDRIDKLDELDELDELDKQDRLDERDRLDELDRIDKQDKLDELAYAIPDRPEK